MKILASDYNKKRLDELSGCIRTVYPEGELIAETDSLMAGKKCFFEAFDIVFASLDDMRLDGVKMKDFARRCNNSAKYFICGSACDLYEWYIIDENGDVCEDGVDGTISYPVTKEKIVSALNGRSIDVSGNSPELDDSMLEFAAGGSGRDCTEDDSYNS